MKVLIILGVLLVYTLVVISAKPLTVQKRVMQAQSECIQENGWNEREIKQLKSKRDFLPKEHVLFSEFEFCLWKKMDVVSGTSINVPLLKKLLVPLAIDKYPNTSEDAIALTVDEAVNRCVDDQPPVAKSLGHALVILHICISQHAEELQNTIRKSD